MEPTDTAVERLQKELDRLVPRSSNQATITINAGGVGVWIATTACCVMLAVSLFLGLWVVDLSAKVSELNQLLNAVYMMAPHLKPENP